MKVLSLRKKLMIILAIAVILPLVGSGYLLIDRAEKALLMEKQNKLFGIARALEKALPGDFDSLLPEDGKNASRQEKVLLLNAKLAGVTDQIAEANPGVGVGYYSRELDSIITYGPSAEYQDKIGQSIGQDHKGREVMANGIPLAVQGPMIRGNILNAMVPITRDGQVIGYVWANELIQSIEKQILAMETFMYLALGVALLLGLGIALPLANGVSSSVQRIIDGLRRLHSDLHYRLPESNAEFGEITAAINEMAQSLADTRSHTELIMESMADGIITVDMAGKLTAVNDSATRITGLAKSMIGKFYSDLLPAQTFHSLLLETLHTGKSFISHEIEFPLSSGDTVPLSVSTSLLKSGDTILGAVVVFKDLTERNVFEERVRRVDRLAAVGELAAGVAHEIRNPLAAISGSVQILLAELPPDNPSRQFGDVIIKEVHRLNGIVEDLLYFAKPSTNYIMQVNLNELVEETLVLLEPSMKKDLITLEKELDSTIGPVSVDVGLIKQVLVNLLLNAIQALPHQGGRLGVATRSVQGGIEIAISDTGEGMVPENLSRIFDPFFTTKDRGTGLGLAVSSKIIEIHHGHIQVDSKLGQGTTFNVFLPKGTGQEVEQERDAANAG